MYAVVVGAGGELVENGKLGLADVDGVGKRRRVDVVIGVVDQIGPRHVDALSLGRGRFAIPLIEPGHVVDVGRQTLVVEHDPVGLATQIVVPAELFGLAFDLLDQLTVEVMELGSRVDVSVDEAFENEQFAGGGGIDRAKADAASWHDDQPEERDPLIGHGRAALRVPMGFAVGPLDEMLGKGLDPGRVDPGTRAEVSSAGFDQLGRHEPLGPFLE